MKFNLSAIDFDPLLTKLEILYRLRNIWELNLAVELQMDITKILVGFSFVIMKVGLQISSYILLCIRRITC